MNPPISESHTHSTDCQALKSVAAISPTAKITILPAPWNNGVCLCGRVCQASIKSQRVVKGLLCF